MNRFIKCILILSLIIPPLCFRSIAMADTLILKNGERITGIIVQQNDEFVKMKIYMGTGIITETYQKDQISEVKEDRKESAEIWQKYMSDVEREVEQEKKRAEYERIQEEIRKSEKEFLQKKEKNRLKKEAYEKKIEESNRRLEAVEMELREETRRLEVEDKKFEEYKKRREEYRKKRAMLKEEDAKYEIKDIVLKFHFDEKLNVMNECYSGKFVNKGKLWKKYVRIIMTFYNTKGKLVSTRTEYTTPTDVYSGKEATFEICIDQELRSVRYTIDYSCEYENSL